MTGEREKGMPQAPRTLPRLDPRRARLPGDPAPSKPSHRRDRDHPDRHLRAPLTPWGPGLRRLSGRRPPAPAPPPVRSPQTADRRAHL